MEAPSRDSPIAAPDPDADLMLAYAAGDAPAFDALYARHKGGVYRYLLRHCGNAATAQELFQEVWMRVIRARREYMPTARFATWLFAIAHHRLVDHWRAAARSNGLFVAASGDGEDPAAVPSDPVDEPLARVESAHVRERLHSAIAALPFAQRDAFLLRHEADLGLAEIAALTGAPVETVKSRLRYATGRLRQLLGDLR